MVDRRGFLGQSALGLSGLCLHAIGAAAAPDAQAGNTGKGATRSLLVAKRYLNLPIRNGAPKRRLRVVLDGKIERQCYVELAEDSPDWWAWLDLTPFKGRTITLEVDEPERGTGVLAALEPADRIRGLENVYREARRPQFHFSARRGWVNDPNGLVYHQGEYHLFYQHNPYGTGWGNLHWGHAVSTDLVHWQELPEALYPDEHGAMFSGSAVVDAHDTAGLQRGAERTMIAAFTAAPVGDERMFATERASRPPHTQGIAFSNDRGRTWKKYEGNPVIGPLFQHTRDPSVSWYEPGRKWIMALYLDRPGSTGPAASEENGFALFESRDLKKWDKLCDVTLSGDGECPNFFEIPVDGDAKNTRWVFYGAKGRYLLGAFDGKTFTPESGPHELQHGNCFYASQTFNNVPAADGRRVLIPWGISRSGVPMLGGAAGATEPLYKGMPFNQMLGLPVELTLRTTPAGLRLCANPVKELERLRGKSHIVAAQALLPGQNPLAGVSGELLEVAAEIATDTAKEIEFILRGVVVHYDVEKQELSCGDKRAPLPAHDGRIKLHLFVDRTSIDIFGNGGELYMPMGLLVPEKEHSLALGVRGGSATLNALQVFELKSAWA